MISSKVKKRYVQEAKKNGIHNDRRKVCMRGNKTKGRRKL
jgi:hypothetical protein